MTTTPVLELQPASWTICDPDPDCNTVLATITREDYWDWSTETAVKANRYKVKANLPPISATSELVRVCDTYEDACVLAADVARRVLHINQMRDGATERQSALSSELRARS